MPFTVDQFLDVFGRYNSAFWPVVVLLWLVSAATIAWWWRNGIAAARPAAGLLAFHWAWSGLVYHWAFFAAVNPAARLFAGLFLFQAICLAWLGVVRPGLRFSRGPGGWRFAGYALILDSFLYPALSLASGHAWPRAPLYAVPCPTTLLTAGMLLMVEGRIPIAIVIPTITWAAIGGSGAFLLDVRPDLALPLAGLLVLVRAVRKDVAKPSAQTMQMAETPHGSTPAPRR